MDEPRAPMEPTATRRALPWAVAVLGLVALVQGWGASPMANGLDFYQFWALGQIAGSPGIGNIYEAEAGKRLGEEFYRRAVTSNERAAVARPRRVLEIASTPFLYTCFGLLSTGDYETDLFAYRVLTYIFALASIAALCAAFGYPLEAGVVAASVILCFYSCLWSDRAVGNVGTLQLGGLAFYLVLQRYPASLGRDLVAGAVIGLLVMFKPNVALVPVLLVAGWFAQRRMGTLLGQVGGMAIGAAVALAASSIRFGSPECWLQWYRGVGGALERSDITVGNGNLSLTRLIYETWGLSVAAVVAAALTIAAIAIAFMRWRRPEDGPADRAVEFERDAISVAAACSIALLSSPLTWLHYFVLAIPAVLYVGRRGAFRDRSRGEIARGVAVIVAALLLAAIGYNDLVVTTFKGRQILVAHTLLHTLAVALTLGLLAAEAWSGPATPAAPATPRPATPR